MSSIAAFSFGALGDFVALLDFAQDVRTLLNASSGGSEDYLMLLVEVDSLVCILKMATAASSTTPPLQLSSAMIQTSCNALKSSQNILTILETKVKTYQDKLRRGGSERMMMESWRKIGWGLLVKDDEVKQLRCQLSYHIKTMQVVLSFAQCTVADEMVRQTKRTLDRLARYLPIGIGYTWEGGATADTAPIRLRNMYDHIVDIPLDLCATPESFDGMLRMYFHGRKGNRFIVKGDYELTTAGSHSLLNLIDHVNWKTAMKPGIVVEMNAIIRRKSRPNNLSNVECPRCRNVVHDARVDACTLCPHCPCSFTISRTNIDDPTNCLTKDFKAFPRPNYSREPDYILGPIEWRIHHAKELEETYSESHALCHVRVLDWLQVRYAGQVPQFEKGIRKLTYIDHIKNREVPVLWEGTRTLSNGVVMHDVLSRETGELLTLSPSALIHNIRILERWLHLFLEPDNKAIFPHLE